MTTFKRDLYQKAIESLDATAVKDNLHRYTYRDLLGFAQYFQQGNRHLQKIGLLMEKSSDYIAAVFALTLSDCSFVPLDPCLPLERLSFIIEDAGITAVICSRKQTDHDIFSSHALERIELLRNRNQDEFSLHLEEEDRELLYTIYTSGTTGVPKGVEVGYSGIGNVIGQQVDIFELDKSNIYLFLSISFDASLSDIYCSFLSGSTLFIDEKIKHDIEAFVDYINAHRISYVDIPPSYLKLIDPSRLSSLKSIVIGGEVADAATVRRYVEKMKVINVYGPTEATICTSYEVCSSQWNRPLIGSPLEGVGYTILNEDLEESQKGELYISGVQLAIGYTNPKLTESRFIVHNGTRYYRTGDQVVQTTEGIEFIGRIDRQVKHNGQLICLEEIEQTINRLSEITNVSVLYNNNKIYTYYEGDIAIESIKEAINRYLPAYMMPNFFINSAIPKTASGKNDSRLLSNKINDRRDLVKAIFSELLSEVEQDENLSFAELGGDSIDFIRLQSRLRSAGIEVSYEQLMNDSTLEGILFAANEKQLKKQDLVDYFNQHSSFDMPMVVNTSIVDQVALVTGANGLLGSHLLVELSKTYDDIYCLVRGVTASDIRAKLQTSERRYGLSFDYEKIHLVPITNLNDPYLGMSRAMYNRLSSEVTTVYHLAAEVNNLASFEALYGTHIEATLKILDFVFKNRLKKLHYASTLSVHVSGEHRDRAVIDEKELVIDDNLLYTGYAQSKWLCDYILTHYNDYQNIYQYRFGLLVPTMNQTTTDRSFLFQLLEELNDSWSAPYDQKNLCFDFTPVDFAAKAMARLAQVGGERIYNISCNDKVYYKDIVALLNKQVMEAHQWFYQDQSDLLRQLLDALYLEQDKKTNLFEMTTIKCIQIDNMSHYLTVPKYNTIKYIKYYIELIRRNKGNR